MSPVIQQSFDSAQEDPVTATHIDIDAQAQFAKGRVGVLRRARGRTLLRLAEPARQLHPRPVAV